MQTHARAHGLGPSPAASGLAPRSAPPVPHLQALRTLPVQAVLAMSRSLARLPSQAAYYRLERMPSHVPYRRRGRLAAVGAKRRPSLTPEDSADSSSGDDSAAWQTLERAATI